MSGSFDEEIIFEKLSRAIDICQEIQNDSRTPLDDALALTPLIRELVKYKRMLREKAFTAAVVDKEYQRAIKQLKVLNQKVKAKVLAHKKTMEFVENTAEAVAAVVDLAIAVGKLAV